MMTPSWQYTIGGGLFGLIFPLSAWTWDLQWQDLPWTWAGVAALHALTPLHWIIDTVPLVSAFGTLWVAARLKPVQTARERAEEAFRASEEQFRSAFECAPIGIALVGLDGRWLRVNRSLCEIVGYSEQELLATNFHALTCLEDRTPNSGSVRRLLTGEIRFSHMEKRYLHKQGRLVWAQTVVSLVRDPSGRPLHFLAQVQDITERKAVERMKGEFISVVSHELRTPLTSIRGALGLLVSGALGTFPERGQRMLEIAVANTNRLIRLINDILDIERIESGKLTLQKQSCDAAVLLTQAAEGIQAMAEEARIILSVYPQSIQFWADPDRILQTLTNLLGNAIKFSPPDTTVWLSVERQGDHVVFQVRDQGRGIPADKIETIFERFQQVDASDSRQKGGTGLGLSICRSLVQQHGGHIWAESSLGQGSSFFFTLPTLKEQPVSVPVSPSPGSEEHPPENASDEQDKMPQALIVEHDRDLANVMMGLLERHGVVTYYAQTGREAIQCCQLVVPDFLVLDPALPEHDGFAVVEWLRRHQSLHHIPLVVYSAQDLDETERARLQLGQTQFFIKGCIPPEELERSIVRLLTRIGPYAGEDRRNGSQAHTRH